MYFTKMFSICACTHVTTNTHCMEITSTVTDGNLPAQVLIKSKYVLTKARLDIPPLLPQSVLRC